MKESKNPSHKPKTTFLKQTKNPQTPNTSKKPTKHQKKRSTQIRPKKNLSNTIERRKDQKNKILNQSDISEKKET